MSSACFIVWKLDGLLRDLFVPALVLTCTSTAHCDVLVLNATELVPSGTVVYLKEVFSAVDEADFAASWSDSLDTSLDALSLHGTMCTAQCAFWHAA